MVDIAAVVGVSRRREALGGSAGDDVRDALHHGPVHTWLHTPSAGLGVSRYLYSMLDHGGDDNDDEDEEEEEDA